MRILIALLLLVLMIAGCAPQSSAPQPSNPPPATEPEKKPVIPRVEIDRESKIPPQQKR